MQKGRSFEIEAAARPRTQCKEDEVPGYTEDEPETSKLARSNLAQSKPAAEVAEDEAEVAADETEARRAARAAFPQALFELCVTSTASFLRLTPHRGH